MFVLLHGRWFHGKISREQAENLLQPREDGLFLVRESTNYPGDYTLCVSFQNDVQHYRVIYKDNKLTIDEEEFFSNLAELVEVSLSFNHSRVECCKTDIMYLNKSSIMKRMLMAYVPNLKEVLQSREKQTFLLTEKILRKQAG